MSDAAFRDLRRLADWFAMSPQRPAHEVERIVKRLGVTAVPFLGRQLRGSDPQRRDAARHALGAIAAYGPPAHERVTAELQVITAGVAADDAKVVAVGLLSELGARADARFSDPAAIRVRSAIALAAHLETPADVAGAADLMVRELCADDIVQMLEVMAEAASCAAHRLASELVQRLDLDGDVRDRIALVIATLPPDAARDERRSGAIPSRPSRGAPVHTAVLVDATGGVAPRPTGGAGRVPASDRFAPLGDEKPEGLAAATRLVVIASRKVAGGRRWRRWAVLVGASGRIDDCLHEDDAGPDGDTSQLIAVLCADGYRVASTELDHAHEVIARAARLTAASPQPLPSHYYLGRDLLGLADAHLGTRGHADPSGAALARAIDLVAAGDHAAALPLLEHCDPDHPDAAAALAVSLLAQDRPAAALAALDRALAAEPAWPLHHWNRAAALHRLGDACGCYHSLRRFVATSALPSGLFADPDQPARVGCALRMIAELERAARLTGKPLRRRAVRRAANRTGRGAQRGVSRSARASKRRRSGST